MAIPATEDSLLMIAQHGTAYHVEKTVRCLRRAQQMEELSREARQQANQSVTYYYDEDGSLVLKASLPAEIGALLIKALDAVIEEIPLTRVPAGTFEKQPTRTARRAAALGVIAESFIQHGPEALNGGDRNQVVIHVDAETLRNNTAAAVNSKMLLLKVERARRVSAEITGAAKSE